MQGDKVRETKEHHRAVKEISERNIKGDGWGASKA